MKRDDEIIVFDVPENVDLHIYPLADLHVGAPEFNLSAWVQFKKKVLADPVGYLVVAGDLMNNGLKSSVTNCYEETMRPREQKQWLCGELDALKDKILCVVPGNHENRSGKDADDNPLYDVCCKLDIEDVYRENAAFLNVRLGNRVNNGQRNPTYMFMCMHGSGGGALTGGSVNRNERFAYCLDGVDILVTGHTHKPLVTAPCKLRVDAQSGKVYRKQFACVTSTGWLEYGGYALRKQLSPCGTRPQMITLCGNHKEFFVTM